MGYVKRDRTKMSLGARLKEERKRLGYNQSDFAELVGSSYKSQLRWEKDESSPSADALNIWASIGLDVLYVVTGRAGTLPFDRLSQKCHRKSRAN
jgi:transcriptional regulator with XRE-family HTH domain